MPSNLKSETARINGAKSHGPKTPEGKARSSQNSLRHGLTAADSATLPIESKEDFQTLLDAYLDRYHPADAIEIELVETLAITRWRLRRVALLESRMLENEIVQSRVSLFAQVVSIEDENRLAFAFRNLANGKALDLLIRYEASLTRAYDRTVKQLDLLQNRKVRNEPAKSVSAPLPVTSLRPSDSTRAVSIAPKDFHLLEEMLRQPPPREERHERAA
jgi:hypothetical protein